ncbi:TAT-variant-translocated molybdopterin oxidoreductase [Terriglobus aquaticus]|uniref:TAT-variant-translocated molybdopterin oxidoreductase n=1 Tax=Terriglobus aquaticus TaxID=940139 RepID=A0ABW9KGA6_9BACT|nr:TAT-variant-translocated molybdopterin oxidoreductase [Terriglobus aquaticus]
MLESTTAASGGAQVVTSIQPAKLSLEEVRSRLDAQGGTKGGKRFWQSIDDLVDAPGFMEMVKEEFPRQASELTEGFSRRGFMKVMGASLALAGVTGCTKQPDEPIYPYVKQPQDLIISKFNYFATAHPFPTGAVPVLVKSREYRPVKIDGNPEHPMSKGKTDVFTQATLLDLYDPDRSKHVIQRTAGQSINADFGGFQTAFAEVVEKLPQGNGLVFLSETITSPTLAAQWKAVQAKYPGAKLVQWEPINQDNARAATKAAFGQYADAQYKLENADVILALDADFLSSNAFPGFLPLSAGFAERRKYEPGKTMNRLYVVETNHTVTGAKADHRLALKPSDIDAFAAALQGGSYTGGNEQAQKFFAALQADLKRSGARAVVIAGPQASVAVNHAALALNQQLGAVGSTVVYTQPVAEIPTEQYADLRNLVNAMNAGQVKALVLLGGNPIYSTPATLGFGPAMSKVPWTASLGMYQDETNVLTSWHINQAHFLESWSDARAYDGTISIVQPMIDPLYGGLTSHDILQTLLDNPSMTSYEVVQATAKTYMKGDSEAAWRKALHDGWVEGTAFTPRSGGISGAAAPAPAPVQSNGGLELVFRHDPSLYDGRYANNGWLQELPKQITRISWDNAALMSMNTMTELKANEEELLELEVNGQKVKFAPLMVPGHADGVVTVHVGQGRWFGRNAQFVGSDAYKLQSVDSPYLSSGLKVNATGEKHNLCVTQVHSMDQRGKTAQSDLQHPDTSGNESLPGHEAMERAIIRSATVAEAQKTPGFAHEGSPLKETPEHEESFFPNAWSYTNQDKSTGTIQNAWGMTIDLNSCIGCNACVVSCYAENNIPVVGREQVKVGRNMQWLRIDTYFEGDLHAPKAHFQPMACQHCENAGCEQVCPVGATVHTPEGLNTMVYNRCVGTRYCSNNCPYKVRRFNFLLYADYDTESLKFMRNPEVSVRSRGVMEKCTYCVQRIEAVKIEADKEGRPIRDGEIITACQEACPTEAIVFGNINDKNSRVAKLKAEERSYQVLADINYRPRTSYIAGVTNPNPELETA